MAASSGRRVMFKRWLVFSLHRSHRPDIRQALLVLGQSGEVWCVVRHQNHSLQPEKRCAQYKQNRAGTQHENCKLTFVVQATPEREVRGAVSRPSSTRRWHPARRREWRWRKHVLWWRPLVLRRRWSLLARRLTPRLFFHLARQRLCPFRLLHTWDSPLLSRRFI